MAGIAVHLIIARKMIKLLPQGTIKEEGLFYAGSIAPDAIHARENYVRAYKKHTHLRDDIPDRDFTGGSYLNLFHKRVADFIFEYRDRKDGLLDVYRGYVVHLLTDELFLITLRQEMVRVMAEQGIDQNDRKFFNNAVTDMNRNDVLLTDHYPEMDEIRRKLEIVKPFQIDNMLSEFELSGSREWVMNRFFHEKHEIIQPEYISFDRTKEFITIATADIVERLSEGGSLPRMF